MRRRDFIAGIAGSAAAWPLAARAQQSATLKMGFLASPTARGYENTVTQVLSGLAERGFSADRNVTIEYRWADGEYDRLPILATELVHQRVNLIFSTGSVMSAIAAKAATSSIPIVFANGSDPVKFGVVASLNRPGGNITGVSFVNNALGPKRLELLHELLPNARKVAILVNPDNPAAISDAQDLISAGRLLGLQGIIVRAVTEAQLESAFETAAQEGAQALLVTNDALFQSRANLLISQSIRYALPAMYTSRSQVVPGGLISYGTNVPVTWPRFLWTPHCPLEPRRNGRHEGYVA